MSTRTKPPTVMPRLADGSIPQQGMTVEHPDGVRGPLLYTVPRRGLDDTVVRNVDDWQTLIRTTTGRAVRRTTRELHPVRS
jgi:hypothetical protein